MYIAVWSCTCSVDVPGGEGQGGPTFSISMQIEFEHIPVGGFRPRVSRQELMWELGLSKDGFASKEST